MEYGAENVLPYNREDGKGAQVRRMFDAIARRYDRLNRLLSLGFDRSWRRKGIATLAPYRPQHILDVATGTGDLAIALCRTLAPEHVTAVDISEGMMDVGRRKAEEAWLGAAITFEQQDSLAMTYPDDSFDAVTAAFGVRNFEHIGQGIAEMCRVLRPGGRLMILELSSPEWFPMNLLFRFYSRVVIPSVGRWVSKERNAYRYLPASIRVVPQGKVMTALLRETGFFDVRSTTFTLGVCSLYTAAKK